MNEESTHPPYAPALIKLLQGIVYYDDEATWTQIREYEQAIRTYFRTIGTELYVSEADGYAFLRQPEDETTEDLPRIVRRVPLNYPTTLLCVLLRERLLQHDTGDIESPRLVVSRADIVEAMLPFFKDRSDETRTVRLIDNAISRIAGMSFITPMKSDEDAFEVRRVLKAHVTADKLADIKSTLEEHAAEG
ncbi:MAG: DUF4194 domain-containing protein [Rhodothermales bacterium]